MTLVLRQGESLEKECKIDTVYGKSIMYVTSHAIILIHDKQGIFLERLHTQIASIEATNKKRIKITWPESHQLFDFTFKINDAVLHVSDILNMHNYDDNFPDMMGVTHVLYNDGDKKKIIEKRLDYAQRNISKISELIKEADNNVRDIAETSNTEKILQAVEKSSHLQNMSKMYSDYIKDIPNICFNRSKKIPKDVENFRCWNDTWIDVKHQCFVTFNQYWKTDVFDNIDNIKKFYDNNKISKCYAIPLNCVIFKNGYPILTDQISKDLQLKKSPYIPTFTDEMLTDKIISETFGFDIETINNLPIQCQPTIHYETSNGSKLILKNGERYKLTRKETVFLMNRQMIPKQELELLP